MDSKSKPERHLTKGVELDRFEPRRSTAGSNFYFDDNERWDAVMRRDRRADGHFYYSVLTTGVYCRPSCPSRSARRENVNFHPTVANAERAGFRPCKRCRPTGPSVLQDHAAVVERACRLIEINEKAPTLGVLAASIGISPFHLHRIFRATVGMTPKAYAAACRGRLPETALRQQNKEVLTDAGPASGSSDTPANSARYRPHRHDERIFFVFGQCLFGSILIGSTETGVCAIMFGDSPDYLMQELQSYFKKEELVSDERYDRLIATIVEFVESPQKGLDLPLDIRGTAFQCRVWKALQEIPVGSTRSYQEIASQLGKPRATRAVVQACMSNPIAVAIPCHRAIKSDGTLSGYRWGAARKRALLQREAKI
jgi:AraC family transcriptional regulator of adaptative response/methylated-DNA-[protein]-cysteine methyltransferase